LKPLRDILIRIIVHVIRLWIYHVPIRKGKGCLYDIARSFVKRWPDIFHETEIRTPDGMRMLVDMNSVCQRSLFLRGDYSPNEARILREKLVPGDIFIDVGAHVGYFSILAAWVVGPKGLVMAFEPSPTMREKLVRNTALNELQNVRILPDAVSNVSGKRSLFVHKSKAGLSSLRPMKSKATGRICVTTVSLDEVLGPEFANRIKLVKLDIEGAELLALQGMKHLLSREQSPDVLCEVTDRFLRELGGSEEELMAYMAGHGYSVVRLPVEGSEPARIHGEYEQYNALFTKRHT